MSTSPPGNGLGVLLEDAWKRKDGLDHWPYRVHQDRIVTFKRNFYYKLLNDDPAISHELQYLDGHWSLGAAEAFAGATPGVLLADLIWSHELTQRLQLRETRLHPGPLRHRPLPKGLSKTSQRQLGYQQFPSLDSVALETTALRYFHHVIDGWTWQEIANAERVQTRSGGTAVPPVRSVIRSVQQFAADLGVTLPSAPRGRPRGRHIKP